MLSSDFIKYLSTSGLRLKVKTFVSIFCLILVKPMGLDFIYLLFISRIQDTFVNRKGTKIGTEKRKKKRTTVIYKQKL